MLTEYAEGLKTDLTKEDQINMPPVVIETVQNRASFKPVCRMTAIETPLHLQSAAGRELQKMLKAGFIEESHKASDYCSRAFFVAKPNCDNLKARTVSVR